MDEVIVALENFLKKFSTPLPKNVVVVRNKVFLVPDSVKEVVDKIKLKPISVGLPLGELKRDGFRSSFALLDMCKESNNKIVISDEAEWLFTCGRDVFLKSIISKGLLKSQFLVVNVKGDVLGLGKKEGKGKDAIIKNLFDRGDFLRREKK